ncbi:MAG: flagellar basal body protein, partial [Methylocystis sp.]
MSINGILSSGLSAILTNSAALRVTANNIANVNTPGYVRRVIHTEAMAPAGQLGGVALADIQRAADAFFDREAVSAQGAFSRYDTQSGIMDQLNGVLGSPGAGSSLSSRLDGLYAALGQATLDPALLANRQGVLYQFQA